MTAHDVVIVGAGASGGVVARRLAEAGISVLCLEQGGWIDRNDYRGASDDWELTARKQWSGSPNVRRRSADYPVDLAASEVALQNFNGVGGGTILYAGQWPRMLPEDFSVLAADGVASNWPFGFEDLLPYYERIDAEIGVSGLAGNPYYPPTGRDYPLPPLPIGQAGLMMARAHHALGWHWWPEPNAIASHDYDGRHACVQRGTCMQGCNEGAKASTDLTHWPKAIAAGATLITDARAMCIDTDGADATGVVWSDATGERHRATGRVVVLAANGVGTARLLLLSASDDHPDGLGNSSGLVGRGLMVHPYSIVVGTFDRDLESSQGHFGASIQSLEFYRSDASRGFVRGAKWGLIPTGGPLRIVLSAADAAVWGEGHHRHLRRRLGRSVAWGVLCEDLPDELNRVTIAPALIDSSGLPAPAIEYRLSDNVKAMMRWNIEKATESLRAAGAMEIDVLEYLPTGHSMGTARMGDDPRRSVVDTVGRVHDTSNVYIVDGSVMPTVGGVNPTSTICALALRTADHLVAEVFTDVGGTRRGATVAPKAAAPPAPTQVDVARRRPVKLTNSDRRRLAVLADEMIPASATMPSGGDAGVSGHLLDHVLAVRPDLTEALQRALRTLTDASAASLHEFAERDPAAHEALRTTVAGAYYLSPRVRDLIGYHGQVAKRINAFVYPQFLEEGLLDHMIGGAT